MFMPIKQTSKNNCFDYLVRVRDTEKFQLILSKLRHDLTSVEDVLKFFQVGNDYFREHFYGLADYFGAMTIRLNLPLYENFKTH
jgi:hypothetical protein